MRQSLIFLATLVTSVVCNATSVSVGTPGNSFLATPTGPSPSLGNLINFDGLPQSGSPVASLSVGGATLNSADGLLVIPFSTQSSPNEAFDNGFNGVADLSIMLGMGTMRIGIGVADSDAVSVTLQALDKNGTALGSAFVEDLGTTQDPNNSGNSYFVISDTGYNIYGLRITQTVANPNFSGLAVDDIQFASVPEPSALALLGGGAVLLGGLRLRKKTVC